MVEPRILFAVEHPDSVDKHAVHADRVAQGTRTAAGQVADPPRRRDADRGGIEQQQIGAGANRDAAAIRDAVQPGLMAGQSAHALGEVESAALVYPVAEEIKTKAR